MNRWKTYRNVSRVCRPYYSQIGRQATEIQVLERIYKTDGLTNLTLPILNRLHGKHQPLQLPKHPLALSWKRITDFFDKNYPGVFHRELHMDPVVRVEENFDELLIPADHPSRSPRDSYYINKDWMLRTHMTAQERRTMACGHRAFLIAGDVYRRDEIDATHMPVFHQLEAARIFSKQELISLSESQATIDDSRFWSVVSSQGSFQTGQDARLTKIVLTDLYETIDGLLRHIFGGETPLNWQSTYFPFTHPSMEVEVERGGKLIEILGSGVLRDAVLHPTVKVQDPEAIGWAFGMGLERVSMILYQIPDIRLFWSLDDRFISQFADDSTDSGPVKFSPFSKYPPIVRDISFYLKEPSQSFSMNDLCELVRQVSPQLVEEVKLIDEYNDKKLGMKSLCYRIIYRSMERTLTDQYVNTLQNELRTLLRERHDVILR